MEKSAQMLAIADKWLEEAMEIISGDKQDALARQIDRKDIE
jgi:hypothetical protein